MRKTIVHISDLHFGRINKPLIQPLIDKIKAVKPDVIVISGDITMRARTKEFVAARDFLKSLDFPQIIVPGNHDIPLYNVYSRFFRSLNKFRHYITEDLEPAYRDDRIAIYGLNSARSFALVRGVVDMNQIRKICAEFDKLPQDVLRIVVTHHPFDLPDGFGAHNLQRKPDEAVKLLINSKVDLMLAGHTHKSLIDHVPKQANGRGYTPLVIQAGTSTSVRTRRESYYNSFNIISVDYPRMIIENVFWDKESCEFFSKRSREFQHSDKGWGVVGIN